ncbi:hypothetical protein RND71_037088 [Anisodus tanguticus]|uniref:Retrovirus-related Pol polyprotein from transposon TNT 1-94-like beta-barrel domain-containing protein n=1 Tax=Anisodus tanguticus TaxID=243964 RepID=A0AAE1R1N4_9SOLA|nr:hypothetical protein RND71_037088 [Anisodus tanguticus]
MIKDCRMLKTEQQEKAKAKGKAQANIIKDKLLDDMIEEFSAVVLEAKIVENPMQWWMDTGATKHICSNRDAFSTYKPVTNKKLFMGNCHDPNRRAATGTRIPPAGYRHSYNKYLSIINYGLNRQKLMTTR